MAPIDKNSLAIMPQAGFALYPITGESGFFSRFCDLGLGMGNGLAQSEYCFEGHALGCAGLFSTAVYYRDLSPWPAIYWKVTFFGRALSK